MRFQLLALCVVIPLWLGSCSAEVPPLGSDSDTRTTENNRGVLEDSGDPCAGVELPECPRACAAGAFQSCGEPCSEDGATCGNEIGDGMTCRGGIWQCTVHAPLGTGCNLVCRPGPA